MQTSREVIDCLVRNKPADRVGHFENVWGQTLQRWVTEGYPTDEEGKPLDVAVVCEHDIGGVAGGLNVEPQLGVSELIEETDEWVIRRNGAGAAHKRWKKRAGVPEHIDFLMTSREVWDRDYRPHLLEVDRTRLNLDAAKQGLANRRKQEKWALMGRSFVWEIMRQSMGDFTLYTALLQDPDWIHDYNRVHTDLFKAHYAILFDEAGVPDGFRLCEDLGYRGGLFCSPKLLEELIFPYYKELVDFFHSYDLPVILHTCGGIEEGLDLIVAAGFDGLDPMEVKAGNDAFRIAENYGDKLQLRGGLDVRLLESGDRELIRKSVTDLVTGMKARGARYIFSTDHSVSEAVSWPDYQYALEVYREHMYY